MERTFRTILFIKARFFFVPSSAVSDFPERLRCTLANNRAKVSQIGSFPLYHYDKVELYRTTSVHA